MGRFTGYGYYALMPQPPKVAGNRVIRVLKKLLGGLGNPMLLRYVPDPDNPLTYHADDGRTFTPESFATDWATTPRLGWNIPGFAPQDWIEAATLHDWFFESYHRGAPVIDFDGANAMLNEMVRVSGVKPWKANLIGYWCQHVGRNLWDYHYTESGEPDYSNPVKV